MLLKYPSHPGSFILNMCMEPNGLSLAQTAKKLGITKKKLDDFVNCRSSVTPKLAISLSKEFGSTPGLWCRMQNNYDLAKDLREIEKLESKQPKPKKPKRVVRIRQTKPITKRAVTPSLRA